MEYKVDLAELRAAMGRKNLNIQSLSEKMGVSRYTVAIVLDGKNPSYAFMTKAIVALELSSDDVTRIFFAPYLRTA